MLRPNRLALPIAILLATAGEAVAVPSLEVGYLTIGADESYHAFQIGLRVAPVPPTPVGLDVALTTTPETIASGGVLLGFLDVGLAVPLPLGDEMALVPRLGGSGFGVAAGGFGGGAYGWNVGAGLVSRPRRGGVGVRVDLTYRSFPSDSDALGITSFSVGLAWHGKPKGPEAHAPR